MWKFDKASKRKSETDERLLDVLSDAMDIREIDKNVIMLHDPQSFEAEKFRMLKTKLLFSMTGKSPRVLMITSAAPGEGKSFISVNLAVSIAMTMDKYVLLVDCDLRRPSIHKYLGIEETEGLSEYLSGEVSGESIFKTTPVKKLTVLPAGNPPPNPSELMASQKMTDLIEDVKTRVKDRYVIIDSPPPKVSSEATFISSLADGVVLVIKHAKTARDQVEELIQSMGKEKIIGVVINQYASVREKFEGERYYKSYYKSKK